MCSILKLFRLNYTHGSQPKKPMVKMTHISMRLAINWVLKNDESTSDVSKGEPAKGQIPPVDKDYLRTLETQSLSDVAESVRQLTENMGEMNRWIKQVVLPILLILAGMVGSFFK